MIRQGRKEDIFVIMNMVQDTINIMKEEGSDQWDETYPLLSHFEEDVKAGSLYVLEDDDNKVVGSITVDKNLPIEYTSIPWRWEKEAFTFHRLVVSAYTRGRGIASELISHAEKIAIQNGVPYLKIDTYSLNQKAHSLFGKNGFTKVGEMSFQGKINPFYCYDKLLS